MTTEAAELVRVPQTYSRVVAGYGALAAVDPEVFNIVEAEALRQDTVLRMTPSENYMPLAVLQAMGSPFANNYAEGYPPPEVGEPNERYYEGQEGNDRIELLTIERAKKLFGLRHAIVQSLSGSPANSSVQLGLLNEGDKMMGLDLYSGGHLRVCLKNL